MIFAITNTSFVVLLLLFPGKLVRGQNPVEGLHPLWVLTAGAPYFASVKNTVSNLYDLGRNGQHTTAPVPKRQLAAFCDLLRIKNYAKWQNGRKLEADLEGKDQLLQKGLAKVADRLQDTLMS